jgi:hypothetical protein
VEMICTHLNYTLNWSIFFRFNCACVVKPLAGQTEQTWHSLACKVKTDGKTVRVWGPLHASKVPCMRYFSRHPLRTFSSILSNYGKESENTSPLFLLTFHAFAQLPRLVAVRKACVVPIWPLLASTNYLPS